MFITVKAARITGDARVEVGLPTKGTPGAAGYDLQNAWDEPVLLRSGERLAFPVGLRFEIPPGYEGQVRPRSGLALSKGVTVLNAPGTIDSDYRGEVRVILINHGRETVVIAPGERIAQLVIAPVTATCFAPVFGLGDTERGEGGFGSTGAGVPVQVDLDDPDGVTLRRVLADIRAEALKGSSGAAERAWGVIRLALGDRAFDVVLSGPGDKLTPGEHAVLRCANIQVGRDKLVAVARARIGRPVDDLVPTVDAQEEEAFIAEVAAGLDDRIRTGGLFAPAQPITESTVISASDLVSPGDELIAKVMESLEASDSKAATLQKTEPASDPDVLLWQFNARGKVDEVAAQRWLAQPLQNRDAHAAGPAGSGALTSNERRHCIDLVVGMQSKLEQLLALLGGAK